MRMAKTLATSLLPAFILILPTGAQAADALLCGRVNGAERTSAHVVVYTSASEPSGDDKIEIDACVPIPTVDSGSECAVAFRGKVADQLAMGRPERAGNRDRSPTILETATAR